MLLAYFSRAVIASLVLPDPDSTLLVLRVGLVAVLAVVLAALGWRHRPAGVNEALVVVGISGGLVGTCAIPVVREAQPLFLGGLLAVLALAWFVVGRWARAVTQAAPAPNHKSLPDGLPAQPALGYAGGGVLTAAFAPVATAAALVCAISAVGVVRPTSPGRWVGGYAAVLVTASYFVALLALGAALLPLVRQWRFHQRVWRSDPRRLVDAPTPRPAWWHTVLALAAVVGGGAWLAPDAWATPFNVFLAAVAALLAAHCHGGAAAGWLGLGLTAEGMILAAVAWLPACGVNATLGCAAAAVYMLWLARFWRQQLLGDVPWTTAGRLIPVARRLGHGLALLCFCVAVGDARADAGNGPLSAWPAAIATLATLLLMSMLVREGSADILPVKTQAGSLRHDYLALAACLAALAAAVAARRCCDALGWPAPWMALLAGAGLILALRVGRQRSELPSDVVYNAFIGGGVPVLILYAAAVRGSEAASWIAPVVTAACALAALALRWPARFPPAAGGAADR